MLPSQSLSSHTLQCPLTRPNLSPFVIRRGLPQNSRFTESTRRHRLSFRPAQAVAEPVSEEASAAPTEGTDQTSQGPTLPRHNQMFLANFLWLEGSIGVCVDQVFGQGQRSPLTEYFLWPRREAWDELKACLEAKTWISEADKNDLLNKTTEVFEYWQEEPKHSLSDAKEQFPDCIFIGS